jgi:hypothetical protein
VSEPWLPGAAGPHEELVARIHAQIQEFTASRSGRGVVVEVELRDGPRVAVHSLTSDPGSGFLTLRPHGEDGDADATPTEEWIVPVAAIARITLSEAEERLVRFGFALPQ